MVQYMRVSCLSEVRGPSGPHQDVVQLDVGRRLPSLKAGDASCHFPCIVH